MIRFFLTFLAVGLPLVFAAHDAFAYHRSQARPHRSHGAPVARGAGYADVVIDGDTGLVLHADNAESSRFPASLTKMMTLYITFQAIEGGRLHLGQRLWVSENASEQSPTKLGLRPGQSIRVEDAVLGLVTESANDAAVVLAEAIGGNEEHFAQMMTRQARALGMTRTQFQNPSGLPDPDQVTCAADMARLGYALIHHYPQFYRYFSEEKFVYAGVARRNHNHLMSRYDGMDGIKTGYIRTSGFNLVASAVRGQTRLIGVVFGGRSAPLRDRQMEGLLDQSFASAPSHGDRQNPVVLVGQNGDADRDGSLTTGDYLALPTKNPAIFAPSRTPVRYEEPEEAAPEAPPAPPVAERLAPQPPQLERPARRVAAPVPRRTARVPAPRPAPVADRKWAIQIGAFADPTVGRQALADLADSIPSLKNGSPILQQVHVNNSALFRARFQTLDERTARSTCASLLREGKSCLIVTPAG